MPKRIGLSFYIEGEYCKRTTDDPNDADWIPFDNRDIHPKKKKTFTVWSQFEDLNEKDKEDLINTIVTVINWLRDDNDWEGFCANLWLSRGEYKDQKVYSWNLA